MAYIPQEILSIACTHLFYQRDFDTLLNCAYSGKRLANIALMNLYRAAPATFISRDEDWVADHNHHGSFSDIDKHNGAEGDEIRAHQRLEGMRSHLQQKRIMNCAGFWRTIILSSLDKTLYPYSHYIRTLNFRELWRLFTTQGFKNRASKCFFQGEVAQLRVFNRDYVVDKLATINKIGEAITKQSPQLEELIGKVFSDELSEWIPRLPRLRYLETWDDAAIEDNGSLIRRHCPLFKGLHLPNSYSPRGNSDPYDESAPSFVGEYDESVPAFAIEHDEPVPAFVNKLRPQSLESFKWFNCHHLGSEIFQALSCHGESLTELGLNFNSNFPDFYFPNLSLLKGCTNLVSLSLARTGRYKSDLKILRLDAFRETFTWLKKCKKLRVLNLNRFLKPSCIAPIFFENSYYATSLENWSLEMQATKIFHQALGNQTSLQRLWLYGDLGGYTVNSDFLAESLSKLVNLTDLRLEDVSKYFVDRHIVQLAGSLPKLEQWSTRASRLTDDIWGEVASLRSLRKLDLQTVTDFTAEGILDFIDKLGPGNNGLALFVRHERYYTDPLWLMKESIQVTAAKIKKKIAKTVEGSFELLFPYQNYRR